MIYIFLWPRLLVSILCSESQLLMVIADTPQISAISCMDFSSLTYFCLIQSSFMYRRSIFLEEAILSLYSNLMNWLQPSHNLVFFSPPVLISICIENGWSHEGHLASTIVTAQLGRLCIITVLNDGGYIWVSCFVRVSGGASGVVGEKSKSALVGLCNERVQVHYIYKFLCFYPTLEFIKEESVFCPTITTNDNVCFVNTGISG